MNRIDVSRTVFSEVRLPFEHGDILRRCSRAVAHEPCADEFELYEKFIFRVYLEIEARGAPASLQPLYGVVRTEAKRQYDRLRSDRRRFARGSFSRENR